jgi:hypothetical protein
MQSRLLPLAALALAGVAYAHGGHEAVPEGSTTSEDPIVRVLFCSVPDLLMRAPLTLFYKGLHAMGAYDSDGSFIWDYLSDWNGSRGMSFFFFFWRWMGAGMLMQCCVL